MDISNLQHPLHVLLERTHYHPPGKQQVGRWMYGERTPTRPTPRLWGLRHHPWLGTQPAFRTQLQTVLLSVPPPVMDAPWPVEHCPLPPPRLPRP